MLVLENYHKDDFDGHCSIYAVLPFKGQTRESKLNKSRMGQPEEGEEEEGGRKGRKEGEKEEKK